MLNLFQHLMESVTYKTLNQVQGDEIVIPTQSRGERVKVREIFPVRGVKPVIESFLERGRHKKDIILTEYYR